MAFPVSAAEGQRQDFLRQPAIKMFELGLVADVAKVIIDNRHAANSCGNRLLGQLHRQPGPGVRVAQTPKFAALASEGVAKKVANLAELIARQSDRAANPILQPEMAKPLQGR